MSSEIVALAERFFRAIETADVAAIGTIYAPDARIWHNYDDKEQTVEENLRVLNWVTRTLSKRHYRVVRRETFPGGFLQQHVLEGVLPDGTQFRVPACIVCSVKDGRITRLDEYIDSDGTKALRAFAGSR